MFQTAGYPAHPPYFSSYDYRTPPRTSPSAGYAYYSPRSYNYTSTPSYKGHTRRATGDGTTYTYTYTSTPRKQNYSAEYASPGYHGSAQSTPQRKTDYVSGSTRKGGASYRMPADDGERTSRKYSSSKQQYSSTRAQYVYDDNGDRSYEYLPRYEQYEQRPPPYKQQHHFHRPHADRKYYDQVPIYESSQQQSTRPRRASYTTKTKSSKEPPRPRTSGASKPPAQATAEDARRHGIPAGYSYKNWDPTEEPILLLGSVFDANSLGKWIYDWTVFYYGAATPMSEVAGELWLLLIQLAGKIKRAEECMPRIRRDEDRDLVDDFLESGERLWERFNKLLKICEAYMWKAAKKECGNSKNVTMGKNSGCEFVDSVFGRDRELERTEKLMTGMRLWSMRFDANCESILRNPGA